jgi:DNA-binding SARP family transcriptional activator/DNA-binding beta-propeller fold protein YncE
LSRPLDFRLLGPLEVRDGDRPLPLGGRKQRTLLAILLLHANEVVSSDTLIDGLWGEHAPKTAGTALQVYVSNLRKLLSAERLETRTPGYLLHVEPDELDLARFERLASEGNGDDPQTAASALAEALTLWRGRPLADFAYDSFAQGEIVRLEELRLAAVEQRIEAELKLGRHAELVGELEALVAEHPHRERLITQLMLALYRSGRQTEALEAYRHARQVLVEELGIEPSPALRELEKAILAQDPALEAPPARLPEEEGALAKPAHTLRRRRELVFGVAVVIVTVGAVGAALHTRREATVDVRPNSVAVIDPGSNKLVGDILVGREPALVAAAGEHVWVGNRLDRNLMKIDPDAPWPLITIPLDAAPAALIARPNAAWVVTAGSRLKLARFDPSFASGPTMEVPIGAEFSTSKAGAAVWGGGLGRTPLAFGDATIWTLGGHESLTRRDPTTLAPHSEVRLLPDFATAIVAGSDATWATTKYSGLLRINPDTNSVVDNVQTPGVPVDVAVGGHWVWIANEGDDVVTRIDPTNPKRLQTPIPVGDGPTAIAYGFDSVWVACKGDATVYRIDPATPKVVKHWKLGASPEDIAAGAGAVWIAVYSKPKP